MYLQSCIWSNNQTIPQDGVPIFNVWATKTQRRARKKQNQRSVIFQSGHNIAIMCPLQVLTFQVKYYIVDYSVLTANYWKRAFSSPHVSEDWGGTTPPSTLSHTHWKAKVLPKSFLAALKLDSLAGGLLRRRNWCGVCINFNCCHWK